MIGETRHQLAGFVFTVPLPLPSHESDTNSWPEPRENL
jgi:hypothetical protein